MDDENENGGADESDETEGSTSLEDALGDHFDKHFAAQGSEGAGADDDDEDDDAADEGDDRPRGRQSSKRADARDEDEDDDSDDDSDESDEDEDEEEEEDGDDPKASKKKKDEDDEDDDEDDDELDLDEEFEEAARRHHIPLSLKNAPPEAKKFIIERAKQMNAGYTRLTQEHATLRKERANLTAERAFQREHPVDFILEMLSKDAGILEKLNTQLEKMRDDEEFRGIRLENIKNRRQDAERSAKEQLEREQERHTRGNELAIFARKTADKYGIPFDLVQPAIVARILASKDLDISEEMVREIIKESSGVYKRHVGAHRGASKRELNKQKLRDREKTRSAAQRRQKGGAATTGRGREKAPKNLFDALDKAAARILPEMPRG